MENLAYKKEHPPIFKNTRFKYNENDDTALLETIFDKTKNLKEFSMEEIIDEIHNKKHFPEKEFILSPREYI